MCVCVCLIHVYVPEWLPVCVLRTSEGCILFFMLRLQFVKVVLYPAIKTRLNVCTTFPSLFFPPENIYKAFQEVPDAGFVVF